MSFHHCRVTPDTKATMFTTTERSVIRDTIQTTKLRRNGCRAQNWSMTFDARIAIGKHTRVATIKKSQLCVRQKIKYSDVHRLHDVHAVEPKPSPIGSKARPKSLRVLI